MKIKLNSDVRDRIKNEFIPNLKVVDYNDIINEIYNTDLRFYKYQPATNDFYVYVCLNQLLDIMNLERQKKYHKIQYEYGDLFSLALGGMVMYGDPYKTLKYRIGLNHNVKGEKHIVDKYLDRFKKYKKLTNEKLNEILRLHEDEQYFQEIQSKTG